MLSASERLSAGRGVDHAWRGKEALRRVHDVVEVFVEPVGELAVVAGFGDLVPRRRIRGKEGIAGVKPVVEEFTRQRIGKAEGDENRHLALLPVRELVVGLLDVLAWIEELHDAKLIERSAGTLARNFEMAAKPRK